jgi:flagellar biogenesis protein FliO
MWTNRIAVLMTALFWLAQPLAAQEVFELEPIITQQDSGSNAEQSPVATDAEKSTTTPDVFVDLSGVNATEEHPAMSDPLAVEIERARATAGQWFRGIGMERWTKQPLLAGCLSVGIVFVGFLLIRTFGRRSTRRVPGRLPRQVVELVGFTPLNSRQQLQLVRVGSKLVLVAVSVTGAEPLAEITDPVEVDQILAACHAGPSNLVAALTQWGNRNRSSQREATGGGRAARALFEA